jgi:eukaryotic-like serine/threonine-protein kinase
MIPVMTQKMARVARRAPGFCLPATSESCQVDLDDFDGEWLVLFFYPGDFTLLCPVEITSLHERYEEFVAAGARVLGVSTDPVETHQQWIEAPKSAGGLGGSLAFPLASDADGEVSRAYGVFLEPQKVALRGLFLIDPNGVLQFSAIHGLTVGRSVEEILRTLSALQSGGMCPPAWSPGQESLDLHSVLQPGRRYEHFEVIDLLGEGGMGSVFKARDVQLRREVALKIFRRGVLAEPEARARFLREAQTAASISHPHICTIHQIEDGPSGMYLVMELIDGEDLQDRMAEGPVEADALVPIGAQIATALAAIHDRGLVHRDIKPSNIRIASNGRAVLLDFGLARPTARAGGDASTVMALTTQGVLVGTVPFMSPEQIELGDVGPPSDVFSLGTTFYVAMTGEHPFATSDYTSTAMRILKGSAPPPRELNPAIPEDLSALVTEMMVRDPGRRPPAHEIARRLQAASSQVIPGLSAVT